ncbi:MAG: hypothetical protein P4L49_13610 [Desulfosporosinus sp.]|nr:hypothetical protein [Desulfosporosinus sp.]
MDKKCDHEERDNMPLPQKDVEKDFAEFVNKNKDLINKIARSNTIQNDAGVTVIPKDDPWRDEHEWDEMYKELKKK